MNPDFDKEQKEQPEDEQRPEIVYPCRWEYKVIGSNREQIEAAILAIVQELNCLDYTLDFSHTSSTGKYCSLLLAITVENEEHRNAIFKALETHPDIRMVL